MDDRQKTLAKVEKVLRQAAGTTYPEEKKTAGAIARRLLRDHHLTGANVEGMSLVDLRRLVSTELRRGVATTTTQETAPPASRSWHVPQEEDAAPPSSPRFGRSFKIVALEDGQWGIVGQAGRVVCRFGTVRGAVGAAYDELHGWGCSSRWSVKECIRVLTTSGTPVSFTIPPASTQWQARGEQGAPPRPRERCHAVPPVALGPSWKLGVALWVVVLLGVLAGAVYANFPHFSQTVLAHLGIIIGR